ncbi:hypothetical protein FD754_007185, partial [Muntiacus muntjak]
KSSKLNALAGLEEEEFGARGIIWYPLCAFVILTACVLACVGLLFQEAPEVKEELLSQQKQLKKIESEELGLNKVWINITEMNKQISLLTSAINHLKANVKLAADLISLPATVEGLQKSITSIGNTLNNIHLSCCGGNTEDCGRIQEIIKLLQSGMNQHALNETNGSNQIILSLPTITELDNKTDSVNLKQDILYLHSFLEEVNSAPGEYQRWKYLKLEGMNEAANNLTQRVNLIERVLVALSKVEKQVNLRIEFVKSQGIKKEEEQVQGFKSKPSALSKFPQSLGDQIEKSAQVRPDLLHNTGCDVDGKLTYQEIRNSLDSVMPAPEHLRVGF